MFKFLLIISIIKIGFTFRIYLLNEEDKVSVPIEFENNTRNVFEDGLLKTIGINKVPSFEINDISREDFSKKYMEEIFKNDKYLMYDISTPDEVICLSPKEIFSNVKESILLFEVSKLLLKDSKLITSELRIIFNKKIYELGWLTASIKRKETEESIMIDTTDMSQLKNTYILNITSILFKWLNTNDNDGIIYIDYNGKSLENFGDYKVIVLTSLQYSNNNKQSIYLDEEKFDINSYRLKRSLIDQNISEKLVPFNFKTHNPFRFYPRCQLHKFFIEFKDLGWDHWVIAPRGYEASYCDGSCTFPLNNNMNATNHAIITTLIHLIDPTRTDPPKCSPTKLKPMKILFIDDNSNVVIKRYQAMMAIECGCQ
ncbi:Transforming growth factor-beta, C-terminal domain-containing protein [Strongyloides ratti]|uniref:Transforming growth factor-beta, C-terminal domain-containing protein n=1 Tax=Strongyloides ratti TaxID=34506 RepID=A0A090MVJ9_STRRB|nr:Transforming growth factor-beta, C-terminal domain-containing protein [Strongyloides ratti]CEF62953.1 Transforming growth factor-beta, C-terminal domain-containing protein [Strongyloides ratti]